VLDPGTEVHAALRAIDPAMPSHVERLIHGQSSIGHLARAVSGTFDVDRCDYLMRDSHMTGVRYGLLDLDWLLQALRLHLPAGASAATLAVDGEKGLTAVEGFFLARLYMYRQVYLHKAVRAAEAVLRALVRRLLEVGPPEDTPVGLSRMLRGESPSVGQYLDLDDHALDGAIRSWASRGDAVLRELADRLRTRRLFKTLRLRPDLAPEVAQARLDEVLARQGVLPAYLGSVDRVEVAAFTEDEAPMVLTGGGARRLLDASPLLHGLSRETFVHYRAIFPPAVRDAVVKAMGDLG
jgi:HD superfamily phosphohydrolase